MRTGSKELFGPTGPGTLALVLAGAEAGGELGRLVDKALGGDPGSLSGKVAVAGGSVAAGVAVWALVGGVVGAGYIALIVVVYVIFVYALTVIVSDINALNYGQKGARAAYDEHWQLAAAKFYNLMIGRPHPSTGQEMTNEGANQLVLSRLAWPLADGYMIQANLLAYRQQMRKPRGVGVSEAYHGRFWSERGKFVGEYLSMDALKYGPTAKCALPDFQALLEQHERLTGVKAVTIEQPDGYRWRLVPKPFPGYWDAKLGKYVELKPPDWVTADMLEPPEQHPDSHAPKWLNHPNGSQFGTVRVEDFWDVVDGPVMRAYSGYIDVFSEKLMEAGARICNIEAWATWNKEPHGIGQSNLAHAKVGQAEGWFLGEVVGSADKPLLSYYDKLFDVNGVPTTDLVTGAANLEAQAA